MKILGLDISTNTGVAVYEDGQIVFTELIFHKPVVAGESHAAASRFLRYDRYRASLHRVLQQHAPDFTYIEGYGYANPNSLATLVEVGTTLRFLLHQLSLPWYEPSPAAVKKFVTGVGNAKKDLMMLEVYKRFGIECVNDNIADAVALAYFGAAHQRQYGKLPKAQLEVAYALTTAKPARKTRKVALTNHG